MNHNLWFITYEWFFNYPVYLPVLWVVEENPSCSYLAFDTFWHDQNYPKHIENRIQDHLSLSLLRKYYFWRISRSIKNRWKSWKFQNFQNFQKFQSFQNFVFEQALNAKYLQIISHHIHMSFSSMNRLSPNIQLPSPESFDNYKTKK